jgi:hypothetical protein
MGYISWLNKYETEESESVMVTLLRKAGAVFYVKTSVPQTLMVCETFNNIIGRTVNPRNKNWSCGGSSGGEGAIVGIRGGIIGVGTDIGKRRLPSNNIFSSNITLKAVLFEFPLLSTSFMVFDQATEECLMLRWRIVWKGRRRFTV